MLPIVWRRILRSIRVLLGLSCVGLQFVSPGPQKLWFPVIFGAYTLYALVLSVWRTSSVGLSDWALAVDSLILFLAIASDSPYFGGMSVALYVFVLATSVIGHDWWPPIVVASLAIIVINFSQPQYYPMLFPVLAGAGILTSGLALERRLLEQRLSNASRQSVLHRYNAEKAREAERQRIAADFHDGPLQSFTSFQIRLEIIRKLMGRNGNEAAAELAELQELCKAQVQELRAFVRSMRPVDVEGSLTVSLRRITDQFQKDTGIPTSFVTADLVDPADPELSIELLQIVREALYNIQKHAGATRVAVSMHKSGPWLEISIEDNGRGFEFSGKFSLEELELLRLGPGSIKSRVRTLGGELLLDSRPGQGAGVRIRLQA